jgi:hypothetical protein
MLLHAAHADVSKRLQPLKLLRRQCHDDGAPILGHCHRLGAGKVDMSAEAVLGVLRRQSLHPVSVVLLVALGQLGRIWPNMQQLGAVNREKSP